MGFLVDELCLNSESLGSTCFAELGLKLLLNPNDLRRLLPNSFLAPALIRVHTISKGALALAVKVQQIAQGALQVPNPIDHGFYITGVVEPLRDAKNGLSGFC
ncbi:MAG: hypothetical protein QOF24_782 [Verrucomicrobiota bacterium]